MTEINNKTQILKPGRILGVLILNLLIMLAAIAAITASMGQTQSQIILVNK